MRNSLATQRLPAEQTVVVPGTRAAAVVIPSLARQLTEILDQRRALEGQLGALLEAHPLSGLLISVPGRGCSAPATILALSATAARSPPPTASPPMPGWRRSPSPPAAPFAAIPSKARYMSGITATPDECSSP